MLPYMSGGSTDTSRGHSRAHRTREDSFAQLIDVNHQEAQEYQTKIEQLQAKISSYESMTVDLEHRLEDSALQCMKAENESILNDKKWALKFEDSTKEVEEWKSRCQKEIDKADSLRNHLSRTERELYGILQKKHQILRGAATASASTTYTEKAASTATPPEVGFKLPVSQMFKSSNDESIQRQNAQIADRRTINSLNEFLGLK